MRITEACPGTAEVATWRGPPGPAPPKPYDGLPHRGASAVIGAGGRTLHSTFTGAPPGHAEYPSAEVPGTGQALVVLPGERHPGPPGWVTAIGCGQAVTVRLARPPGERVLIDLDASNGDGPPG